MVGALLIGERVFGTYRTMERQSSAKEELEASGWGQDRGIAAGLLEPFLYRTVSGKQEAQ
jgi:hypothetical protein